MFLNHPLTQTRVKSKTNFVESESTSYSGYRVYRTTVGCYKQAFRFRLHHHDRKLLWWSVSVNFPSLGNLWCQPKNRRSYRRRRRWRTTNYPARRKIHLFKRCSIGNRNRHHGRSLFYVVFEQPRVWSTDTKIYIKRAPNLALRSDKIAPYLNAVLPIFAGVWVANRIKIRDSGPISLYLLPINLCKLLIYICFSTHLGCQLWTRFSQ